jgi:hypothetical protein
VFLPVHRAALNFLSTESFCPINRGTRPMSRHAEILAEMRSIFDTFHELVERTSRPNDSESEIVFQAKALTKRHSELLDELSKIDNGLAQRSRKPRKAIILGQIVESSSRPISC